MCTFTCLFESSSQKLSVECRPDNECINALRSLHCNNGNKKFLHEGNKSLNAKQKSRAHKHAPKVS